MVEHDILHQVDFGEPDVGRRLVARPRRERGEVVGVGDAHEDPLDDVDVGEDADVEEGGAGGIDALEREQPPSTPAVDHRKDGDAVCPDPHDDRVVDGRRDPVRRVKRQQASRRVDDVLRCAAEGLAVLDGLKRVPEVDLAAGDDKVGRAVKTSACVRASCRKNSRHDWKWRRRPNKAVNSVFERTSPVRQRQNFATGRFALK